MTETKNYVDNIYKQQSETSARVQLYNFARENGYNLHTVDKALEVYKYDTEEDSWGELRFTKKAIASIVEYVINND